MVCNKCKIEARIAKTRYVTEKDTTPDEETLLYIEQHFTCRNPNCTEYKKEIGVVRNQLQLSKDET